MPSPAVSRIIFGQQISPQAAAFLARTSGMGPVYRKATIRYINGLVSAGIWDKLDTRYLFATDVQANGLLNIVSSSYAATANGSPTFTAGRGFTGVAGSTTVYIDSGFNPSTAGGRYTQNSAHMMCYSWNDDTADTGTSSGLVTPGATTVSQILLRYTSNLAYFRINDNVTSSGGVAVTSAKGLYHSVRTGSSAQAGYIDGVDKGVTPVASAALTNATFPILCQREGGSFFSGDDCQLGVWGAGGGLTLADTQADTLLWARYVSDIGGTL
jgi:hypothetical protein